MRNVRTLAAMALAIALTSMPPALADQTGVSAGGYTDEACTGQGANTALAVTASAAYTGGNEVGPLLALSFARPPPAGRPSGILQSVRLTSKSAQTVEFDVTFFSQQPAATTWTDKTTPAIAGADVGFVLPPVKLAANFSGLGTHTVYGQDGIGRAVKLSPNSSTTIWAVITTPGTPTFTATTDLQLCASVLQD